MPTTLTLGSRIRERRLDQGLRQAEVAESAGISASYLNLIEHNKRRIGGKLLAQLAEILSVDVTTLSRGGDPATLDGMRAAAARFPDMTEVDRAADLAARYPGWARLIADQEVRVDALESEVQSLSDRMTHDPALASALHNVISAVTSIRATAGILVSGDRVDADWQSRFHENIHDDSHKLAVESKALVSYLDQSKEVGPVEVGVSVFDQVDHFIDVTPDLIAAIDSGQASSPDAILGGFDLSTLGKHARAVKSAGDPAEIARHFGVDLSAVLRRLAYLPTSFGLPPMGLAVCDAAGALTTLKAIPGLGLHRRSVSCPLWPLYTALVQPASTHQRVVTLPDPGETRFLCYATAGVASAHRFGSPPEVESTMLVVADPELNGADVTPVGTTCRVCPRPQCRARREPSVMSGLGEG